jgi:N-acetyl-anhydromuramyl-L-alanine amidase AmpD
VRRIDLLVVHCSANQPSADIGVAEIRRMHQDLGKTDVGYHRVIRRNGRIEAGRPIEQVGAHARPYNRHSIGICLIGGIDARGRAENNFTPAQFEALDDELTHFFSLYPDAQLCGHRDLSPDLNGDGRITPNEWMKMCPCFDVREWWGQTVGRTLEPLALPRRGV